MLGDARLSDTARGLILDAGNEILASPATYWEIAIKVSIGKLALHAPYEDFIALCLDRYGFRTLPIEPVHTARRSSVLYEPQGPVRPTPCGSGAIAEGVPLVSNDEALDAYPIRRLW
ncbi:MAG: type II toxin-antitoxin system VapC family toxin [Isosphaeraceae bacterium]